jgi:hypothetical protein
MSGDQTIAESAYGNGTYVRTHAMYCIVINKHIARAGAKASVVYRADGEIRSYYDEDLTKVNSDEIPSDVKMKLYGFYSKFINDMSAYELGERVICSDRMGPMGTIKSKVVDGYSVQFDDVLVRGTELYKASQLKAAC